MRRGHLRVYLGYAAGTGKTFAMLEEGHRRMERGTDVAIGVVETHGRALTAQRQEGLELIPRKKIVHRGSEFEDMDLEAILARAPEVVLVDELAHTNIPGTHNAKRWQDVEELLEVGITVVTTVNVQHFESLNDVVERITGIAQRETIPDEIVRNADQIELVDMSPWALRRRMAHGNIYPPEKIDVALTNYFREGNLAALRELALLWLADRVEESLKDYIDQYEIAGPWETRERVLVGLSGRAEGARLIRRAARIASRRAAELIAVHVIGEDGRGEQEGEDLESHRQLLQALGGTFHEVLGDDVASALLDVARAEGATQIVLGSSSRSRWSELIRGSAVHRVIRESGPIDVHVISSQEEEHERLGRQIRAGLPRRRVLGGMLLGGLALPALTLSLDSFRQNLVLSTILLLYLLVVVLVSSVGGVWAAAPTATAASLLVNWFFTPPTHTWTIARPENAVAIVTFVAVALTVGWLVGIAARRRMQAERARSEAALLASLAGSLVRNDDPLPDLLEKLRTGFGMTAAAIMQRSEGGWTTEAAAGQPLPSTPDDADTTIAVGENTTLVLVGRKLASEDRKVLAAFAAQLAVAVRSRALGRQAEKASEIARTSDLRAAILAAVSHDLRTPLASVKASVSSLRQKDVSWTQEEVDEFLSTIEEETDRLTILVSNLLDMSRLQAGAVTTMSQPVGLEEVVAKALATVQDRGRSVDVDVPESLPRVRADPSLLERAIANLVDNAVTWSPPGKGVRLDADLHQEHIIMRVVDRGPGIPEADRERVLQPFQRGSHSRNGSGAGLGLAVAKGFIETMGGRLILTETPGGGLTALVTFEVSS